jgi:hypothetical protein
MVNAQPKKPVMKRPIGMAPKRASGVPFAEADVEKYQRCAEPNPVMQRPPGAGEIRLVPEAMASIAQTAARIGERDSINAGK